MENMTPRILIIEDDSISGRLLKAMLEHLGYEVFHALRAGDAVAEMCETQFALVLLDWVMPVTDGGEMLAMIRSGMAGNQHRNVPVVVITADLINCRREACIKAGANDYITKPVNLKELGIVVNRFLPGVHEAQPALMKETGSVPA